MTWVGGISLGMFALGVVVYVFGTPLGAQGQPGGLAGPSGGLRSQEVRNDHRRSLSTMTLDSTTLHADATEGDDPLSARPADGRGDRVGGGDRHGVRIRHADTEVRDDPAGGAGQDRRADVRRRRRAAAARSPSMYDAAAKMIYEAVVDLGARVIDSWKPIPGRFPSYLVEHMTGVEEKVREDPRWQEAMRKRGVTDFGLAMIDPWPAGYYGAQDHYDNSPLICRPLTFMRAAPSEHGYARPVEGLIVTFDLDNDGGHRHRGPRRGADAADGGQLRREVHVRPEQPAGVHRVPCRRQADRDHPARRARASPSTGGR